MLPRSKVAPPLLVPTGRVRNCCWYFTTRLLHSACAQLVARGTPGSAERACSKHPAQFEFAHFVSSRGAERPHTSTPGTQTGSGLSPALRYAEFAQRAYWLPPLAGGHLHQSRSLGLGLTGLAPLHWLSHLSNFSSLTPIIKYAKQLIPHPCMLYMQVHTRIHVYMQVHTCMADATQEHCTPLHKAFSKWRRYASNTVTREALGARSQRSPLEVRRDKDRRCLARGSTAPWRPAVTRTATAGPNRGRNLRPAMPAAIERCIANTLGGAPKAAAAAPGSRGQLSWRRRSESGGQRVPGVWGTPAAGTRRRA